MDIKNLTIIGTSHISKNSVKEVSKFISDEKPDFVCVELDKGRYFSLKNEIKNKVSIRDIFSVGIKGYIFALIGGFVQKKLGKKIGSMPGEDMLQAVNVAKENECRVYLIDQNIGITLKKFSKAWGVKETFILIKEFFVGIFKKKKVAFDIRNVPSEDVIEELILEVKDKFPSVYKVLIEDRNRYMARKLAKILKNNSEKKVLAVVGAGHKKGMLELLKNKFE